MVGGGPNALRTVAIAFSTLAALALLFGLLFIQVRDAGLEHTRQFNYGELGRVQHQLRDWVDVLVQRVETNAAAKDEKSRLKAVEQPYAIDDIVTPKPASGAPAAADAAKTPPATATAELSSGASVPAVGTKTPPGSEESPARPGLCSRLFGDAKVADGGFALEFNGAQRRDNRVMLAHRAASDCSQVNVTPILAGGDSRFSPTDLAVVGNDGRVLLVLRGNADWPPETLLPLMATDEGAKAQPRKPLIEPVEIKLGGEKWDLYAVPLEFGRTIRVGGADGADCAPRRCMLVALGRRAGPAESLRGLSPIVRTSFAALALLVLLLIPLLKLRTIDQNGSMHWVEVAALIVSVPTAIAVVTLLLAAQGDWVWQRLKQDAVASAHARQLAGELDTEIKVSLAEAVDRAGCIRAIGTESPCKPHWVRQALPLRSLSVRHLRDSGLVPDRAIVLSYFDRASSVEDRDYFRRLKTDDKLLRLGDVLASAAEWRKSLFELLRLGDVLRSKDAPPTTEWRYTVAQVPDLYQNKSLLVAGLRPESEYCKTVGAPDCFLLGTKTLASTLQRPMPPGFGFAVIDPNTFEVLQHSDPTQQHSQHFDEQITRTGWLDSLSRAMPVLCRAGGTTAAEPLPPAEMLYRGETVRMTLTPACVPRWIVATWYSRTHEQHAVTLAARFAGAFAVLILAAVALLALGAGTLRRDRLIATIWPTPEVLTAKGEFRESGRANRDLQAGLPVLVVYLAALLALFEGDARLWLALAIVILTALAFYRAYYRPEAHDPRPAFPGMRDWLTLFGRRQSFVAPLPKPGMTLLILPVVMLAVLASAWFGVRWFAVTAILFGGVLAWHIRPVGRLVATVWSAGRKRFGGNAATAAPPARAVEAIAHKTRPVRMAQLWAMVLLAVLAPLAAYGAATDATADATARRYVGEAALARKEAGEQICAVLAKYEIKKADQVCGARDGKAVAEQLGHNLFWPGLTKGDRPSGSPDSRRWAGAATVEAVLRQVSSPDEFADFTAARFNGRSDDSQQAAASDRPAVGEGESSLFPVALMLAVVLVLLLALAGFVLGLLRLLNHGLFGLHHFEFRSLHPQMLADPLAKTLEAVGMNRVLFIDFPLKEYDDLCARLDTEGGYELLHLGQLRDDVEARPPETFGRKPWVIRGFESIISSSELRRKALQLLERLAAHREIEIYFFSEMLPLERIKHQREREKEDKRLAKQQARSYESEAFRWAELFLSFATFRHEDQRDFENLRSCEPGKTSLNEEERQRVAKWLEQTGEEATIIDDELLAIPSWRVWRQRITFADPNENSLPSTTNPPVREQIYEYLANFLGDYYQGQWVRSSKEEHLVMFHLAHGRFVNADNFSVINNLLTRGLVRREPDFRLMNRSFEHWIRTLEHPRWFEAFRAKVEQGGAWHALRIPVLLLAVTGAIAAAYLDQGMSGSLLTMVPAIAAAVPLLIGRITQTRNALGE